MRVLLTICTTVAFLVTNNTQAEPADSLGHSSFCRPVAALFMVDESESVSKLHVEDSGSLVSFAQISKDLLVESVRHGPNWDARFGEFSMSLVGWSATHDFRTKLPWLRMSADMVDVGIRAAELFSFDRSGSWIRASINKALPALVGRSPDEVRVFILLTDGDPLWWGGHDAAQSIRGSLDLNGIELIPMVVNHPNRMKQDDDGNFNPSLASKSSMRELKVVSSLGQVIVGSDPSSMTNALERDLATLACSAF